MAILHFLGTGSGLLNPARNASAYLVQTDLGDILLDAGEPVAATLARRSYDWARLAALVITHTHADHTGGVRMLIQQLHLSARTAPLRVHAPSEYAERLRDTLALHYLFPEALRFPLEIQPLSDRGEFALCGVACLALPTGHLHPARARAAEFGYANRGEAFALRLQVGERRLFYSGDVAAFADVREALVDVHLAVLDSTHTDLDVVIAFAWEHREVEIVLSHVAPDLDTDALAQKLAAAKIDWVRLAEDGAALPL
jgi:ribonuclease BN (tRNA processing enzyme)